MTAAAFAFYLFAASALVAGLMVVTARNPVHSVLWLILAFLSSAGLFVLMGAEFVAMLLIIVYVGAVAVLFLFVVMMLDVDFSELKAEMAKYMPLALLIGVAISHSRLLTKEPNLVFNFIQRVFSPRMVKSLSKIFFRVENLFNVHI